MVDVAQLVEHQIVALGVEGSNPSIHPKFKNSCINCKIQYIIHVIRRGVAQLVAHSLWERGVVSSSLATPTTLKNLNLMS